MSRRFAISCVVLLVALAAGARTRPHYGGSLRVEISGDPWQMPDGLARRLVLDTLTTLSDSGSAEPALATQWQADTSAHRWELSIRPGAHFHDGTPLTAELVAASLQQTCAAPATGGCPWSAVRAVGSSVIFTSESPLPDLPELLAQTQFAIARQDATGALDGTGPFRVTGFANGALMLTADDDSWQGRPYLDTIQIFPRRTMRDQALDLSIGRADLIEVAPDVIRQAQQQHLAVLVSQPVDLLALTIAPEGPLANLQTRQSIALAVDRAALYNVIFQKQGEISASLLPASLSGYSFLFPAERNLDRARSVRGPVPPGTLSLSVIDATPSLQLAAERLALNLREDGFNVQITNGSHPGAQLTLRRVHLQATAPRAALDEMAAQFGQNGRVNGADPVSLWQSEQAILANGTIVPLVWLPRAWAAGDRVRDLRLSPDGVPLLANAAVEGAQ
jgi:peptide/nickel transport system substrate-binding protein